MPYDLGAHWIYTPDANPLAKLAAQVKRDIYAAPRGQSLRIGPRPARDSETEAFLAALVRSHRAIADAAPARRCIGSCSRLRRSDTNPRR